MATMQPDTHVSAVPRFVKFNNSIIGAFLRSGVPVGPNILITIPGRKSGIPHTNPVAIFEFNGQRYVQSTFGRNIDWVKNLRAAGFATIRKGRHEERIRAEELTIQEAGPIYRNIVPMMPSMVRKQFAVDNDASLPDFIELAKDHPMFRIAPVSA